MSRNLGMSDMVTARTLAGAAQSYPIDHDPGVVVLPKHFYAILDRKRSSTDNFELYDHNMRWKCHQKGVNIEVLLPPKQASLKASNNVF